MNRKQRKRRGADRELILTALAWILIATPAMALWASPRRGWLAPYVLWLALIAACWGLSRLRRDDHDGP